MQLAHELGERVRVVGGELGEAEGAVARPVRAGGVRDARARLPRPEGAQLGQVAVVVLVVALLVAREVGELVEGLADRAAARAAVVLQRLEPLQRALLLRVRARVRVRLGLELGLGLGLG